MLNIDDRLIKEVSPKIGANALSVLLAIAIHLNQKTNRCFPSHHRIMSLTGLGRDAVYSALSRLQKEGLLQSEQKIDSEKKTFSKRVFRVSTRFIQVFVCAEDMEPLPENPYTANPHTDEPYTANPETYLINHTQQIKQLEQINNVGENTPAPAPTPANGGVSFPLEEKEKISLDIPPARDENSAAAPRWQEIPRADTPRELETYLTGFYSKYPHELTYICERTQFQNNTSGVPAAIADFCTWAVGEGWNRRPLRQINARLGRWLRDEKRFNTNTTARGAQPVNTPTVVAPQTQIRYAK